MKKTLINEYKPTYLCHEKHSEGQDFVFYNFHVVFLFVFPHFY